MTILDLPDTTTWTDLLADIAAGAKDRDLDDVNPFDQVAALKRAGFGTLRLPTELGGAGVTVPQLFSAVIDVARADPVVAHIFRTHFWFVEERLRTLTSPDRGPGCRRSPTARCSAMRSARRAPTRWAASCSTPAWRPATTADSP